MLASAYGLKYELPQDSIAGKPVRGGLAQPQQEQAQVDYGQGNLLGDSLYVKEGMTDQYYKKVAALKSFANEVSSRYGYDVTRPNYRDRESIKFHKAYLEALADIQRDQNELKRLGKAEELSIQSPNVVMRTDEATGRDFAANIGENDIVKRIATTAKEIQSQEQADVFMNEFKPAIIEQLRAEINSSQDPRERAELEASLRQIEAITPDVGISPAQREQLRIQESGRIEQERHNKATEAIQRQRASESGGGGRPSQAELNAIGRFQTMLQLNDPATLEASNLERVEMASGTFLRKKGNTNSDEWVKIDPNNPEAFMRKLNGLINEDRSDTSVGFDVLQRSGVDISEFSKGLVGKIGSSQDITASLDLNFDKIATLAKGDMETAKVVVEAIERGGMIPDDVANKMGSSLSNKKITNISAESGLVGSNRIKISVPNRSGNGIKQVSLSFAEPEDLKIIKNIINFNKDRIPKSVLEKILPKNQPTGTNVAQSQVESLEDIL